MRNIKLLSKNEDKVVVGVEGKTYNLLPHTFSALSNDENDPLYCVSVANNSFSIDPWKGCPMNCAYCHVQGCYSDLQNWTNCYMPHRRSRFSDEEIVAALIRHEWFIPHKSVISIGTSSTEPFLDDNMICSTLTIMKSFADRGLRNPFWIVTKAGFPGKAYKDRFREILANGNSIVVSVCWSNNPAHIERQSGNRFRNLVLAKELGIKLNWYMRPLCDEWNTSEESLTKVFDTVVSYAPYIDNIAPGGLRWTEGVEFGIWAVHDQPMPVLTKEDNVKTLSDNSISKIKEMCGRTLPDKPVYLKSSCALSNLLDIPNFNLVDLFSPDYCAMSSCPEKQRKLCMERKIRLTEALADQCRKLGFHVEEKEDTLSIEKLRPTTYQENEIVRKILSFSEE